jgi:hypothetical protein
MTAEAPFSKAELERLRSDFEYFCERLLRINPKIKELVASGAETDAGALIPFRWNMAQRYVWLAMCEMLARGVPVKLVILKARQVGISTFFCAYMFWQMWRQENYRAAIVAYEKKTTLAELNETMATFYDALPAGYKPRLRQHRKEGGRINKEDVYFDDRKSNAMFVVQKPNALRGTARDGVLTTEVAFYKDADEFYGGFLPAMGAGPSSFLVLESSPADGYFKDAYDLAKSGTTDRVAIFIPWWMVRDLYWRPLTRRGRGIFDAVTGERVVFEADMKKKQKHLTRLAAKRGLPPVADEQMWWWIARCASDYQGDVEWMQQEFPDDDVTAFQRASRSAFKVCLPAVKATVEEIEDVFPDMAAGQLVSATYTNPENETQTVFFEPEPYDGYIDQEHRPGLLMLEPPKDGYTYVVGADVADAEGEDDEEGERAFSVGCVYCCNSRNQVAEWRGHLDPTDWGDELVKLGYFYNAALLVVERNNMGRLTEQRIRQLGYPRRFKWPDFNVGAHKLTNKEMWETNATTKTLMIGAFRQWVRDGMFRVRTPGLQDEMAHYVVKHGKFMSNDRAADRIIAASLCVQGVEQTEFAYKGIVLGANRAEELRSAGGMAARILRKTKTPPRPRDESELPSEFDDLGVQRVSDIFAAAGF